jgi:Tn7-like transposition protein D
MSLRAIAKSLLVSCDAVRKNALKLGLPLVRPGRRPMSVKAYSHLVTTKVTRRQRKVEASRKRWQAMKVRLPDLGMRGLREKLPADYMVLWRNDREWLEANLPPRRKRQPSVDWACRDRQMCRKLETAACRLRNAAPTKLAKAVGVNGWLSDRLSKLPQARKALERLASVSRN